MLFLQPQRGEIFIAVESQNPKLHRSDMELKMPPRWGFSSFGVGGYNDVAAPELKYGSSAAVLTAALIQGQWGLGDEGFE